MLPSVVFFGSAPFAVPSLQALLDAGHPVHAVVTQPDRPHGRGMRPGPGPVKRAALGAGLPVLQPEKASALEFVESVRALQPDVLAVVAYGQILKPALLDLPRLAAINVHGSLLPALRGAAPIQHAVIQGLPVTGVCTMFMDPGMDTGDVCLCWETAIDPDETAGELSARLAPEGARLLVETLARLQAGGAPRFPQDPGRATYAPPLRREDGRIDWRRSAVEIRNRIHGCNPSPGAFGLWSGAPLKLWRARALPEQAGAPPGTVVRADPLVVAAGEGRLELTEVQPASRPRMRGADFARGARMHPGKSVLE
jgi:methionyl-tRNA formyltransferase